METTARIEELSQKFEESGLTIAEIEERADLMGESVPYVGHADEFLCKSRFKDATALLGKLGILGELPADGAITRKQAAEAIARLYNKTNEKANTYAEKVAAAESADKPCSINLLITMLDCAMGVAEYDQAYTKSEYLECTWTAGYLNGIGSFGARDYPATAELMTAILYNALEGRWCVGENMVDKHIRGIIDFKHESTAHMPEVIHAVYSMDMKGRKIVREHWKAGNTPFYTYSLDDGKKKPLIVYLHGGSCSINTPTEVEYAYKFAEKGFLVAAVEFYSHGERDQEDPVYIPDVTVRSVNDVNEVLDYIKENMPEVDLTKWGMSGFSLGACNTLFYATHGKYHPAAIATFAGMSDAVLQYAPPADINEESHIADSEHEAGRAGGLVHEAHGTGVFSSKLGFSFLDLTKEYCLAKNIEASAWLHKEKLLDVAVLLMHGENDPLGFFAEDNSKLTAYLNAEGKYVRYYIQPGMNHNVTIEELKLAVEHFDRWLK